MPALSILIVNYKVKYFLEQCLLSVYKAIQGISAEIIVVDNHSADGSVEFIRSKFPGLVLIETGENLGFARANNLALAKAAGEYILFLNPDTLVGEGTISCCLDFMRETPDAGACGVSMIEGRGKYLKESKRGFPGPWTAFCKMSGLTAIFPKSGLFARYYLGNLDEHENHPVEILSGAFIMVKKSVLENTGGFDEQFFMYAEDIDLSYRILQAGYQNYYLAKTQILHFKGESTRKDFRYVKLFYRAMSQFIRKQMHGAGSKLLLLAFDFAIWLRAGIAAAENMFRGTKTTKPLSQVKVNFRGDQETAAQLRNSLPEDLNFVYTSPGEAQLLVYCEGPECSFEQIFAEIQRAEGKAGKRIYARGAGSIIGSDSSREQGMPIPLV
jgi:N-acetylglucosaminyl-diphospho-decaprenol L-rhamnosyltransferase